MKLTQRVWDFILKNVEALIWITVLILFALSPVNSNQHFVICPLKLAGFEHCPGCGLGRALILLLHGQIAESITMHPLAIFAFAVIVIRIVQVLWNYSKFKKQLSTNS